MNRLPRFAERNFNLESKPSRIIMLLSTGATDRKILVLNDEPKAQGSLIKSMLVQSV
jgi:hypothetical protein